MLVTKTILASELLAYVTTNIIKSMIDIGDGKLTLLMYKNINPNMIKQLNLDLQSNIRDYEKLVKCPAKRGYSISHY